MFWFTDKRNRIAEIITLRFIAKIITTFCVWLYVMVIEYLLRALSYYLNIVHIQTNFSTKFVGYQCIKVGHSMTHLFWLLCWLVCKYCYTTSWHCIKINNYVVVPWPFSLKINLPVSSFYLYELQKSVIMAVIVILAFQYESSWLGNWGLLI